MMTQESAEVNFQSQFAFRCSECDVTLWSDFYRKKGVCPDYLDLDSTPKELESRLSLLTL